ncbi:MAG: ATP-dependent Clp protease proteolytic subunit, partial [uncultured Solirubrobacteraceae bacterium]
APGPDRDRAHRSRRARVRHLLPAAQRADHLPREPDRRHDRQPRRGPAAAPGVPGSRQGHLDLHQLARRLDLRRPGDLRHDELHQARRGDDLHRHRDVHGLAAAHRRHRGQALRAPELADPDPPAVRRVRGPVLGHRDPHERDPQDPQARGRDLRAAHGPVRGPGPRGHGARPLLHVAAGRRVRPDRPRDRQAL